jgi:hypothetical protein
VPETGSIWHRDRFAKPRSDVEREVVTERAASEGRYGSGPMLRSWELTQLQRAAAISTFPDDWIYLRQKTRVVREHIPSK